MVFQPIVRLTSGEVVGYEALGRGTEAPLQLLDRALREGRLAELDWIFQELAVGVARTGAWDSQHLLFINVDTRVDTDPLARAEQLQRAAENAGLKAGQLAVELGERGPSLDAVEVLAHTYRQAGFQVALDDVGAGYASLSSVVRARPDIVKLDIALVRGVATDPLRAQLMRALAHFSREAGVPLVAEGIEDFADVRALLQCGVEYGQGFALGMPASDPTRVTSQICDRLCEIAASIPPQPSLLVQSPASIGALAARR